MLRNLGRVGYPIIEALLILQHTGESKAKHTGESATCINGISYIHIIKFFVPIDL